MQDFLTHLLGSNPLPYIIMAALPLGFILTYAIVVILGEIKISAWMQHRMGPMEAGPYGVFQPIADILKLLQKEALRPLSADGKLFQLAPFIVFIGSYAAFAVVPFSPFYIGADINTGVFYIIAVSSIVIIGIFMSGWASNNKYTLIGSIRSVAQVISYEIPGGFIVLGMVMLAGTLSMQGIIEQQGGGFWNWYIMGGPKGVSTTSFITGHEVFTGGTGSSILLTPLMLLSFLIFYVCGLAETNRVPFDLPEAESELVAGYNTEYSAMKYAVFYLAEYANMFAVSAVAVTLFLGGWHSPLPKFFVQMLNMDSKLMIGLEGVMWFVAKSFGLVLMQILLRWTLPRLRVDQMMHLCWKVFLPIGFAMVLIVGAWVTFVMPTPDAKAMQKTEQAAPAEGNEGGAAPADSAKGEAPKPDAASSGAAATTDTVAKSQAPGTTTDSASSGAPTGDTAKAN